MTSPISPYGPAMPSLGSYGSLYTAPASPTNGLPPANTGTTNAGVTGQYSPATNPLGGAQGDPMAMIMQVLSMITTLLSTLMGGQQNALDIGPGFSGKPQNSTNNNLPPELANRGNTPFAVGNALDNASEVGTQALQKNSTTDPAQKARLDKTLSKIAQDPEGGRLLQKALEKGYKIEVGDPSQAQGAHDVSTCPSCKAAMDAGQQVNGITVPNTKTIIINPNAPDFDKTVGHELVHAATEGDGNSQTEEGMADVIGYRIDSRINGKAAPGSEQDIYQAKLASYPDLNAGNDIMNSLRQLGIQV